jgi:error-prone DNA polymerase
VILFQETVLKVCRDMAGFTAGKGELVRRALGSKYAAELLAGLRAEFVAGAVNNGISQEIAEEVFTKLQAFGSYSFPKSHAAAFAVVVYQSAWLKCYYPAEFLCSIINNAPMGFWSPSVVLNDAKHHGIRILPVSVNHSQARCKVKNSALCLGLSNVNGIGATGSTRILEARRAGLFVNLFDFCQRTKLPRSLIQNLALAGALDEFDRDRRRVIWKLSSLQYHEAELPLVYPETTLELEPFSSMEAFAYQHKVLGLSADQHPMNFYSNGQKERGIIDSLVLSKKQNGELVRVGGLVVMHQAPPTANGVHFVTLEDAAGFINIIFHPKAYTQYRKVVRGYAMLLIEGEVQRKGQVINVVAARATPLV